jgi:hypothetical protein
LPAEATFAYSITFIQARRDSWLDGTDLEN